MSKKIDRRDDADAPQFNRRDYLKVGGLALGAASAPALLVSETGTAQSAPARLADPAPSDNQVGGGAEYGNKLSRSSGDYYVNTRNELLNALNNANSGDVIWIENGANIDLTNDTHLSMDDGVTLASGRGTNDARGGLLYITNVNGPIFKTTSVNVRITGLRFEGPRTDYFDPGDGNYDENAVDGFWFYGTTGGTFDVEIDNCQMYGFTHAPISIGARNYPTAANIHHCSLHNNQMEGLGYGINLYDGQSTIEWNYFDYNRHSIAGYGFPTNGYLARFNLVGPNPVSHAFDMHELTESNPVAGGTIDINNNTFQFEVDQLGRDQEGVTIRGTPDNICTIEGNRFYHPTRPDSNNIEENGQAFRQLDYDHDDNWDNLTYSNNEYGVRTEIDSVRTGQPGDSTWHTVNINGPYYNPVVIMKPVGYNGHQPCHIRLRNVNANSFEFQIEEWMYQDGYHNANTMSYLVMEEDDQETIDAKDYEVGTVAADEHWTSINFSQNFNQKPVVFTQVQTVVGPQPIVTRNRNVSTNGFETRIYEAEGNNGIHYDETVGYFAIEPGIVGFIGTEFEVGTTANTVDEHFHRINFSDSHGSNPNFLADLQTTDGTNTCNLRYWNLDANSVEVKLEEEQSADSETNHTTEEVGYLVTSRNGLI